MNELAVRQLLFGHSKLGYTLSESCTTKLALEYFQNKRIKIMIPNEEKESDIQEIPCQDCNQTYVGETDRTPKKQVSERKQAVRRSDSSTGTAVRLPRQAHRIEWDSASVVGTAVQDWREKVLEAVPVWTSPRAMNLDHCGLSFWDPALWLPP